MIRVSWNHLAKEPVKKTFTSHLWQSFSHISREVEDVESEGPCFKPSTSIVEAADWSWGHGGSAQGPRVMDAESGKVFLGGVVADGWPLDTPISSEKPLQDWVVDSECMLGDSESEDVLHSVNPNEVFGGGLPAEPSSESDSGASFEEPYVEGPVTLVSAVSTATSQAAPATVFQVVYDISRLGGARVGPGQENVVSIELDQWSSQLLLSDSCVVNELPATSTARPPSPDGDLLYPDLQLTDEEQKLLTEEGVSLPSNLPLTKAEERILKKVRRKIRNKQSAQDSRRRRKEYIDGLESRAAACSQQNRDLQRTVEQLEKCNMSLLAQLQQLQSLIKRTASKGAQTSTCLLIILVSLALIIMPSFSPFSRLSSTDDDYRPRGVISRNILTDPLSSQPTADDGDGPHVRSSELSQSGPPESPSVQQEPVENPGATQVGTQSGNGSAVLDEQIGLLGQMEGSDTAKPAHADEM
ncbi:cyclic AMP-responsive element-binding protein 3-like protein 4 [Xenentodon cancila]